MSKRLTDVAIRNLKPRTDRYELPDGGCQGLYCIVQPSGFRSFAVRFRFDGKPRKLSLDTASLSEARKLATDALDKAEKGADPCQEKRAAKHQQRAVAANTFERVAERYLQLEAGMKGEGDNVTFSGAMRTAGRRLADLRRLIFPVIGNRPIVDIRRSEIAALLDKIQINNGPVAADRALGMISAVMHWFAARSDNYVPPIVRGMRRSKDAERARERILTDDEIRSIWAATEDHQPFEQLIRFLMLSGARRAEGAGLRWCEVKDRSWTLPASRNKIKRDLERPLSDAAIAAIESQRSRNTDFVFAAPGGKPYATFSRLKELLDKASGTSAWTLHDLRRTCRSLMSRAGVEPHVAERALGHLPAGIVQVYDRHSYRRELAEAYERVAELISRIANPPDGSKVIPMRGRS